MICVRVTSGGYEDARVEHPTMASWKKEAETGDLLLANAEGEVQICYPRGEWRSVETISEIRPTLEQVAEAVDAVLWGSVLITDREKCRDVALSIIEQLRQGSTHSQ